MLFNSHVFLFAFLPAVLVGWWALRRPALRLVFLTAASYFFYAWWNYRFLPLMLLSTGIDYAAGNLLARSDDGRRRRLVLVAALGSNLAILAYFKYAGFFVDTLNGFGGTLGFQQRLPALQIVLPIGISFYTFNSMSYTIDIYRRRVAPAPSWLHFAAFVALFPHLIAGPIVRYAVMDEQLRRLRPRLTWELAAAGVFFFSCGLAKKEIVADTLAPHVSALFSAHAGLGLVSGWCAAVGYSLQLYFDFSGYSDMAVGLAYLLGFQFPQNFDSPFKARNISEFWRRWHMSLSFWLRDYLFIPLGGSRAGRLRTLQNLAVTMFLGGLWHGAAGTFVAWGLLHGTFLVAHSLARGAGLTPRSALASRALTFAAVAAAFVVFRAPSMAVAGDVLGAMFGLHGLDSPGRVRTLVGGAFGLELLALLVFVNVAPNTWEVRLPSLPLRRVASGLAIAVAFTWGVLLVQNPSPFLYYQF